MVDTTLRQTVAAPALSLAEAALAWEASIGTPAYAAACGALLAACHDARHAPALRVPRSEWRRDLDAARRIVDPVVRARRLDAVAEAAVSAWEGVGA